MSTPTTIIKTAIQYLPSYTDGCFVDDLSEITGMMFKEQGVVCDCTGSSTTKHVYNNKYSFKNQHCKSARHKKYLTSLSNNSEHILKTAILRRDEIRRLKIAVGKVDQRNHQLMNDNANKTTQITRLKEQVDETNELIEQQKEYHNTKYKTLITMHKSLRKEYNQLKISTNKISNLENENKELQDKNKELQDKNKELQDNIQIIDNLWNKFGQALGYDVEISHE